LPPSPEADRRPPERPQWLTVARITRTRGLRGEVVAHLSTDFPQALAERKEVFLWDGETEPRPVKVTRARFHKNTLLFQFEGINSIEAAEPLVGLKIQLPRSKATPLPAGAHYLHDLAGCRVVEVGTGNELGEVREVEGTPGNFRLAVITPEGKELLIPFAEEFCPRIDTEAKIIEVTLPDGLLDLYS
jgi:16S rRNA processing protein RimM